jgi:hypothetical protein
VSTPSIPTAAPAFLDSKTIPTALVIAPSLIAQITPPNILATHSADAGANAEISGYAKPVISALEISMQTAIAPFATSVSLVLFPTARDLAQLVSIALTMPQASPVSGEAVNAAVAQNGRE